MTHIIVGMKAPNFQGIDHDNNPISLNDYKGKNLILFFYPKDNTPGCTAAACHLRDHYNELNDLGYAMLGVSPDSPKSHQKFINKFNFPFPLLSDQDKTVLNAYGVWGQKKFIGRTFEGVIRTTFIIDTKGIISHVITKVKTKTHASQILDLIQAPSQ